MRLLLQPMETAASRIEGELWPAESSILKIATEGLSNCVCKINSVNINAWDAAYYRYETSNPALENRGLILKDLRPILADPNVVITHATHQDANRRTDFRKSIGLTEILVFDTALAQGPWAVAEGLFQAAVWLSGMVYGELLVELFGFMPYYDWHYNPNYAYNPSTGKTSMETFYSDPANVKAYGGPRLDRMFEIWRARKAGIHTPGYFDLQESGRTPWEWSGRDCDAERHLRWDRGLVIPDFE